MRSSNRPKSWLEKTSDLPYLFRRIVSIFCWPSGHSLHGHCSYPRAICEMMGKEVVHRIKKYRNNGLKQDHRGIKQRYYPMHGFGNLQAAALFVGNLMSYGGVFVSVKAWARRCRSSNNDEHFANGLQPSRRSFSHISFTIVFDEYLCIMETSYSPV